MEKHEALKWRWEFMRRNSEYKRDYAKVAKLRKKANRYSQEDRTEYHFTKEGIQESEYCQKWEIGEMFDPGRSFEELFTCIGLDLRDEDSDAEKAQKWAMQFYYKLKLNNLDHGAIGIISVGPRQFEIRKVRSMMHFHDRFVISIDFDKVNSLKALQNEVSAILEQYYESYESAGWAITEESGKAKLTFKEQKKKHQKYSTNYDLLLRVGEMKEKGMTNQQIARALFLDDLPNPESSIRMVSHYYKSYKELIDGGYKRITYP